MLLICHNNGDSRQAIIEDIMPCVNFCSTNNHTGIFIFSKKVIDCRIVEIPPKLITKLDNIMAILIFFNFDNSRQPFVISIPPCNNSFIGEGKKLKRGERAVIIRKNIAITTPTDRMLNALSSKICDKSCFCDDEEGEEFCGLEGVSFL